MALGGDTRQQDEVTPEPRNLSLTRDTLGIAHSSLFDFFNLDCSFFKQHSDIAIQPPLRPTKPERLPLCDNGPRDVAFEGKRLDWTIHSFHLAASTRPSSSVSGRTTLDSTYSSTGMRVTES